MGKTWKKLIALALVMCTVMSFAVPMTFAATDPVVYNFDRHFEYDKLPDPYETTKPNQIAFAITGQLGESACQQSIPERYASGDMNWTYEAASAGICGTTAETEHLPNLNFRFYEETGMRGIISTKEWFAIRIKSPGKGNFALDMEISKYAGGPVTALYILEAEGEVSIDHDLVMQRRQKIHTAMDPANRVGMIALDECTSAVHSAYIGNWNFEEDKEYIVVFENYQNVPVSGNGYMCLRKLTFTPGTSSKQPLLAQDCVDSVLVKKDVVPASDGGSMGALWEVNGHDYFYLPLEGGKMAIYDLDLWTLVGMTDSNLYYPTSATVTQDGKVVIGGDGKKLFIYDTKTGVGYNTPDFRAVTTLNGEGHNSGVHAGSDGYIYFGTLYGGHMVRYDMNTKTYEDFGDIVCGDIQRMVFPNIKDDAIENTGAVETVYYHNGMLYAWASSASYDIIVRYDMAQGKVTGAVDVTDQLGSVSNMRGMSVFGDKYLSAGGGGVSGLVWIDLTDFTQVTYSQATKRGIIAASSNAESLWEVGMQGHATEVIDGKMYFNSNKVGMFCYTLSTGKLTRVGGGGYGFRTGSKTMVTLDRNGDGVEEPYLFSMGGSPVNPRLFDFTNFNKMNADGLIQTSYEGAGGSSLNIGTVYDDVLYIGAWNNWNCVAYDTKTETILSRYVTGGQTDSQTYYVDQNGKFHLISGNYSACVVYEIDPLNKTGYNNDTDTNIVKPLISNMKRYQQKRIHTVATGDGYVFAGTIPGSYILGGGVGVHNLATGEEDFIRFKETPTNGEKVTTQSKLWDLSVTGIVYQDERVFGITARSGGSGSVASENSSAQIFVLDYKKMEIEAVLDLREVIPEYLPKDANGNVAPITFIGGINVDDQGRLWSIVSDVLFCFAYDKATKSFTVQVIKDVGHSGYNTSGGNVRQNRRPVFDPANNSVYMKFFTNNAGLQQIVLEDWNAPVGSIKVATNRIVLDSKINTYAIGANNNLYYVVGEDLYMIPINVTESDWAKAKAVDEKISALGNITSASAQALEEARAAYDSLSLRDKALVQNEYVLEEAEAEILERKVEDAVEQLSAGSTSQLAQLMLDYKDLSEQQQRYVKNYETLLVAYDTAVWFQENDEANAVQEQIFQLEVNTRRDEETVVLLREAYNALPEESRKVINTKKLVEAEEKLESIKNAVGQQHTYDFKLFENEAYIAALKAGVTELGAPADFVITAGHSLYKYSDTYKYAPYKWFNGGAFPETINWAPEGADAAAPVNNLGKDYSVSESTGLMLSFVKPTDSIKQNFSAVRIDVPAAGNYNVELSLFEGAGGRRLDTNDVLDIYIFPAYEDYKLSTENGEQIKSYLTQSNYAGSLTYITQSNATDVSTYQIAKDYALEAGEYIVVIRENAIGTCRYVYLDELTLTEEAEVAEQEAIAQVGEKYFVNLNDALSYQAESGAEAVKLTYDVWEDDLVFPASAVLDLNGYTLTADSVLTYASNDIIDSSAGNTGVLKLTSVDGNMLAAENSQLPLYDKEAGGYRFFQMEVTAVTVTGKEDPKYWFRITSEDFAEIYKLKESGLLIKVKLSWNGGEAEAVADAAFTQKWADAYNANQDIYITVTAVNVEGFEGFALTPCVTANGVDIPGDEM